MRIKDVSFLLNRRAQGIGEAPHGYTPSTHTRSITIPTEITKFALSLLSLGYFWRVNIPQQV